MTPVRVSFTDRPLLDLGCGYGALGCTLAACGARITMLDSDWRAVKLARLNLKDNGLAGEVLFGDAAKIPLGPFDMAVSNPSTHAGSETLQKLFHSSIRVSKQLVIVVRVHLRYEKWFEGRYRFEHLDKRDGYKVIAIALTP